MLAPRSWRWVLPVAIFAASLLLRLEAYRVVTGSQSFYWPICRAWELAGGGIGWIISQQSSPLRKGLLPITAGLVGAIAVLSCTADFGVVPQSDLHPSYQACLAAACALGLLGLQADGLWRPIWCRPLLWLGNISYALYLVHWPVLATWRAVTYDSTIAPLPAAVLVGVSIVLALALHHMVERPIHRWPIQHPALPFIFALAGAVPLALGAIAISRDAERWLPDNRMFLFQACGKAGFDHAAECSHGPGKPDTLLFGDSLAAHLVPGLEASDPQLSFIQATKPACGPTFDLKQRFIAFETLRTASECLKYTMQVRSWMAEHHEIRLVILGGSWLAGFEARKRSVALYRTDKLGRTVGVPYDRDLLVRAEAQTIAELRKYGARVIVVAPPPPPIFDAGMCFGALKSGKWMPFSGTCTFSLAQHRDVRDEEDILLARLATEAKVPIFRFDGRLCNAGHCGADWQGRALFHDQGHFSPDGWSGLARDIDFAHHLEKLAR